MFAWNARRLSRLCANNPWLVYPRHHTHTHARTRIPSLVAAALGPVVEPGMLPGPINHRNDWAVIRAWVIRYRLELQVWCVCVCDVCDVCDVCEGGLNGVKGGG